MGLRPPPPPPGFFRNAVAEWLEAERIIQQPANARRILGYDIFDQEAQWIAEATAETFSEFRARLEADAVLYSGPPIPPTPRGTLPPPSRPPPPPLRTLRV